MQYVSQRCRFPNEKGIRLAGIVDSPRDRKPVATALFAHCFTCTKDLKAIARISRQLVQHGMATLRFDFTGLGDSEGEFSATTFHDNVADVRAAAAWMGSGLQSPRLLIGHSLGGAAVLTAAGDIPSAQAAVNIASPAHTHHLARFLGAANPAIEANGQGAVTIGGRSHLISREMVKVLRDTDHEQTLKDLRLPLLILFSPEDETLPWEHARRMLELAAGPTSLVTLDGADHLLVNRAEDVKWVADLISTWASRYMTADPT